METIFEEVRLRLETDEKLVKKVNGVYEFKIHRKDGLTQFWTMDLTSFQVLFQKDPMQMQSAVWNSANSRSWK